MSEAGAIVKVVAFLSLMAVLVAALADDGRVPTEITAWNDLETTITTGVDFPSFENPFTAQLLAGKLYPTSDGWYDPDATPTGCSDPGFWECLRSMDEDTSYISLADGVDDIVTVKTGSIGGDSEITAMVMHVYCRSTGTAEPFVMAISTSAAAPPNIYVLQSSQQPLVCPVSDEYVRMTASIPGKNPVSGADWSFAYVKNDWQVGIFGDDTSSTGTGRYTYLEVEVYTNNIPTCTGNWWEDTACQLRRLGSILVSAFVFVFNAIAFAILTVVAVLVFFGTVVFALLAGIISTVQFFLAIPGAPSNVQSLIGTSFVIAIIVFVVYVGARLIRGNE